MKSLEAGETRDMAVSFLLEFGGQDDVAAVVAALVYAGDQLAEISCLLDDLTTLRDRESES